MRRTWICFSRLRAWAMPYEDCVLMSVTWACGAPIEMKIDHGGTEITEKTLKKLKLRVSVVNDFRRGVSIFTPKAFSMRSAMSPERPALPGLSCSVPPFRRGGERMGHPLE